MQNHFNVIVVGGGTGGIMTAAQLRRRDRSLSIVIIEPSEKHYYLPAWTLVGAGAFKYRKTIRDEAGLIPEGVTWVKDYVTDFEPLSNKLNTRGSGAFYYDALVISAGLQYDIDALPGLREALGTDIVCSNYVDPEKTFEVLKQFKGGNAVFTQPAGVIRCGGAPQKIMYLAEEYFKRSGVRKKTNVIFATPGTVIFGTREFALELNRIIEKKKVVFKPYYKPVKIDPEKQEISFQFIKPGEQLTSDSLDKKIDEKLESENIISIHYDMLHLAPPQSAPDFIKQSPFAHLAGPHKGYVNVNIHTMQHNEYKNVFALGDCAGLPTAKTGAAARKQARVLVGNVVRVLGGEPLSEQVYEGYSSCPIVTGYGKMLLCEFKYDNIRDSDPLLSKIMDTTKERRSMWILKKFGLPWLYWNMMMKGRM